MGQGFIGRLLSLALEQVGEAGERGECRWAILLLDRRRDINWVSDLIPLVLIVVTVEAEQLPVASVRRIVIVVVILVMDRELVQLFTIEFASAVRTDPRKYFECMFSMALVPLRLAAPCHKSPGRMAIRS